jgi:hypothetical protein
MEHSCQPVVGIDRRQYPDIVPALAKLTGELFDMREDAAGVGVGVRANKSYAHPRRVAGRAA